MKFANCMLNLSYDLICVCETWLTEDVTNASIFLENYEVYRNDRTVTASRKSRHGGVLIAVSNRIAHEPIRMKCPKADYLVVKIELKERSLILCCIYNAPFSNVYQWTHDELSGFLEEINDLKLALEPSRCDIIITGDINFSQTNWKTLSSSDLYEIPILEKFTDLNLTQHAPTQLDVMLCDNPELIVSCDIDEPLIKMITNRFSNDKPVTCILVNNSECKLDKLKSHQYAFNRADWDGLNESIKTQPFSPYCYSSVNEIVRQWYDWLWEKIDKFVPRVTEHRKKLPPWITNPTSHLIKKLETIKKNQTKTLNGY